MNDTNGYIKTTIEDGVVFIGKHLKTILLQRVRQMVSRNSHKVDIDSSILSPAIFSGSSSRRKNVGVHSKIKAKGLSVRIRPSRPFCAYGGMADTTDLKSVTINLVASSSLARRIVSYLVQIKAVLNKGQFNSVSVAEYRREGSYV